MEDSWLQKFGTKGGQPLGFLRAKLYEVSLGFEDIELH